MARDDGEQLHEWSDEEIMAQPQDGHWFYGLVEHEGKEHLAEILPGYGAALMDDPLDLEDDDVKHALMDCWDLEPTYVGREMDVRAGAARARFDQLEAEIRDRATLDCAHPNRTLILAGPEGGSWCPDCWRFFRFDEPEELPEGQLQVMMPPRIVNSLKEKLGGA